MQSLFSSNLFNGVSFEWALTHMSFPRILPNSSCFRVILKFFFKFDVKMNYHQSYVFLQDRSNSFHCWFNLSNFHSRVPQQFLMVFLVVILWFEDWRSVSSKSYAFSWEFSVQAWCHPLIIVFDCENSFHPFGVIQESFQFDSSEAIISGLFIPAFSYCSPNLTRSSKNA